jgi:ribosome recycling factor
MMDPGTLEEIYDDAGLRMMGAVEALEKDLRGVRTGRANAGLLDGLRVQYYGEDMPINQVATVSVPEARLILIRAWDQNAVPEIEKAILASSLGLTPMVEKNIIRLAVPPLSEERRKQLVSHVKDRGEQAKVAIRNVRRDANRQVDAIKKAGKAPEDDCAKSKDEVQQLTKDNESEVEKFLKGKIDELMEV